MKILIIGSGGREHAIAWKLAQSPKVDKIYVAPGNGGTACEHKTENISIKPGNFEGLRDFALKERVGLTVVGPEAPLAEGIVDVFAAAGLKVFGPCKKAAQIEASKSFAKDVMKKASVPTASYKRFTDASAAKEWVRKRGAPVVVKADGLAAGKGVSVALTIEEALNAVDDILVKKIFNDAGTSLVVEDYLEGEELSYLVITDGKTVLPLASAQDHKAVYEGDTGPNTGGMGAYSPAQVLDEKEYDRLAASVAEPIIKELAARGIVYKGVLYAGLMLTAEGPKVLEYNCRFGDPETQAILPRLETDLLDIFMAVCDDRLTDLAARWKKDPCVCVVMTSGGYPGAYSVGYPISGLDEAQKVPGVKVFHSGTVKEGDVLKTSGGRVLSVTATAADIRNAVDSAYQGVCAIDFQDAHHRADIAHRALKRLNQ